jgi:hypothetical protein
VFDVTSARSNGSVRRVIELGYAQRGERLRPDTQRPLNALLHKYDFPVIEAQSDEIAVIVEIDKSLARAFLLLARQLGQQIVAVQVHLEGHISCFVASFTVAIRSGVGTKSGPPPVVTRATNSIIDFLAGPHSTTVMDLFARVPRWSQTQKDKESARSFLYIFQIWCVREF